jgi:hypothetical protein
MKSETIKVGARAFFTTLLVAAMVCVPAMTHPQESTGPHGAASFRHEFGGLPPAMEKARLESEILLRVSYDLRRDIDDLSGLTCGSVRGPSRAVARR